MGCLESRDVDPGLKGFKGVEPRGHFYQGVGVRCIGMWGRFRRCVEHMGV